jgi:hypothetical protein
VLTIDAANVKANAEETVIQPLGELVPSAHQALVKAETQLTDELISRAESRAAGVLKTRSGRFLSSFRKRISDDPDSVIAVVYSTDAKASILEFGAKIPPHVIEPKKARVLLMNLGGGKSFAAKVHSPGATLPPHLILHAVFAEMQTEILAELEQAAGDSGHHYRTRADSGL